jgi:hypothetical protein
MNRTALVLVLAAGLVFAAFPAAAQDALSKRVSLDLKAMAPADAFKVIGDSVGMKVTVDATLTAPVDILVKNVTAKTALTTICESIGCRWSVSNDVIAVAPRADFAIRARGTGADPKSEKARETTARLQAALKRTLPAGMKFENTPLADVSARLSDALDLKIELTSSDPNLRTLTADFSSQTLMDALKGAFPPGDRSYSWRIAISTRDADSKSPVIMLGIKADAKKK